MQYETQKHTFEGVVPLAEQQTRQRVDAKHREQHERMWAYDPDTGTRLRKLEPDPRCASLHGGYRALKYTFCTSCGQQLT